MTPINVTAYHQPTLLTNPDASIPTYLVDQDPYPLDSLVYPLGPTSAQNGDKPEVEPENVKVKKKAK
ncbi:hypothetical protein Moror_9240 [Moniliophthora roreri MCA 2997]|nr:hypothetical protein Moror_9240 [Moniliophthora roreri MCA 2997]